MINKKSIAIDLDDTLNTLVDNWIRLYNKDYDDNLKKENITNWDIASFTKPECGKKLFDYTLQPNFFKSLGIKPHAKEVTKWLSEYLNLYIVTAYHPKTCLDKAEWLEEHFPHIPQKNIVFCNNKGLIKADFMIDDGGHNITDFYNTNKSSTPIVFDAPWNRYLGNQFVRAMDWLEIKEIIKEQMYFK